MKKNISDFDKLERLTELVNENLFYLDPMHTGSVENELYDEYSRVAEGIATHIISGSSIQDAVNRELIFWFGEDDYSEKVLTISNSLNEVINFYDKKQDN